MIPPECVFWEVPNYGPHCTVRSVIQVPPYSRNRQTSHHGPAPLERGDNSKILLGILSSVHRINASYHTALLKLNIKLLAILGPALR